MIKKDNKDLYRKVKSYLLMKGEYNGVENLPTVDKEREEVVGGIVVRYGLSEDVQYMGKSVEEIAQIMDRVVSDLNEKAGASGARGRNKLIREFKKEGKCSRLVELLM